LLAAGYQSQFDVEGKNVLTTFAVFAIFEKTQTQHNISYLIITALGSLRAALQLIALYYKPLNYIE
jgi:hypothetical protein